MKYHFYLGLLLLALACEKTDPIPPVLPPVEPEQVDTAYGYPPRVVYNCLGFDTIDFDYPVIPGWSKTLIQSNLGIAAYGKICFVDEMNGFIFRYGIIIKTTDGGLTWTEVYNRPNTSFYKISFSSADHGVVACLDTNHQIYFLITYNGGNTWIETQNIGSKFSFPTQIQFVAPDLGYISGGLQTTNFSFNLYKTIDSAKTWTPVLQDSSSNFSGGFHFQSRDTGYYATFSYQLLRSTDGGQRWAFTETPVNGASDVRAFDDSFAVVYGLDGVAITRSGGNRWDKVSFRPTSAGQFFADGSAVLYQQITNCNTVTEGDTYAFVTTNDFGATWKVGPLTKTPGYYNSYCFINERCMISLGQDGELYKWIRS